MNALPLSVSCRHSRRARRHPWPPLLAAALGLLTLAGCGPTPPSVTVGQPFPALSLSGLDGAQLALAQQRGRVVLLHLWATWCPPCRAEMPRLEALGQQLDGERFTLLGLSVDEDANLVREFNLRHGIRFARYIDPGMAIAKGRLDVRVFPTTFVIGRNGTLLRTIVGETDWDSPALLQTLEHDYAREGAH